MSVVESGTASVGTEVAVAAADGPGTALAAMSAMTVADVVVGEAVVVSTVVKGRSVVVGETVIRPAVTGTAAVATVSVVGKVAVLVFALVTGPDAAADGPGVAAVDEPEMTGLDAVEAVDKPAVAGGVVAVAGAVAEAVDGPVEAVAKPVVAGRAVVRTPITPALNYGFQLWAMSLSHTAKCVSCETHSVINPD